MVVAPSAKRIKGVPTLKRPRERTLSPGCSSPSTIETPSPISVDTPPESNSSASGNAPVAETWVRQPHALSGYMVNREGRVVNKCNEIIGLVTHGHLGSVAGRRVDRDGYIFNEYGEMLGPCSTLVRYFFSQIYFFSITTMISVVLLHSQLSTSALQSTT